MRQVKYLNTNFKNSRMIVGVFITKFSWMKTHFFDKKNQGKCKLEQLYSFIQKQSGSLSCFRHGPQKPNFAKINSRDFTRMRAKINFNKIRNLISCNTSTFYFHFLNKLVSVLWMQPVFMKILFAVFILLRERNIDTVLKNTPVLNFFYFVQRSSHFFSLSSWKFSTS